MCKQGIKIGRATTFTSIGQTIPQGDRQRIAGNDAARIAVVMTFDMVGGTANDEVVTLCAVMGNTLAPIMAISPDHPYAHATVESHGQLVMAELYATCRGTNDAACLFSLVRLPVDLEDL